MPFKGFSFAHGTPANDRSDDKPKGPPSVERPPAQTKKTPADITPAPKS